MTDAKYNPYLENGYENRKVYIKSIAEEYDVPLESVVAIAMLLGPSEDFDALIALVDELAYFS